MANGWNKVKGLFWQSGEDEQTSDGVPNDLGEILTPLRDLQGVLGSLVVDAGGVVLGTDLPRVFDEPTIRELGRRMLDLRVALRSDAGEPFSSTLEFEGYSFHVKAFTSKMIGVLMDDTAQKPALGMALNLVSRRVATTLGVAQL